MVAGVVEEVVAVVGVAAVVEADGSVADVVVDEAAVEAVAEAEVEAAVVEEAEAAGEVAEAESHRSSVPSGLFSCGMLASSGEVPHFMLMLHCFAGEVHSCTRSSAYAETLLDSDFPPLL
mmetsp:Transcript_1638/g.4493  ORF Transcript_1638/g.4493 Transcript_1638/m.4493 type:complete len:120 (-) Transcript_1638:87-446(-)